MDRAERLELEEKLRNLHDGGRLRDAVTLAIERYGPEVMGLLLAIARDDELAKEAYSDWMEDLWRGAGAFRFASSFRTWAYTLARHALQRRSVAARRLVMVRWSDAPEVEALAARARTETAPHLRTAARSKVARLREALDADEQTLLVLRIDRGLSWLEVAQVMKGPGAEVSAADAAAVRKRFERVKARLRVLAEPAEQP